MTAPNPGTVDIEKQIRSERYGRKWGPLFWRANVTVAGRFFADAGWELRWIGFAIPFTNWGVGLLFKKRCLAAPGDPNA